VVTIMFVNALQNKPVEDAENQGFPWWAAIISVVILFLLGRVLLKQNLQPRPVEVFEDRHNPFNNTIFENKDEETL